MFFECRDVSYRYGDSAVPIFENLSYSLDIPGFHALFGPSGVGKTSFAKILSGQVNGFDGAIHSEGPVLYSYNLERLPAWASVGAHLEKMTLPSREDLKNELVAAFGVEDVLGKRFTQLSLGQKNRLNLLRYLVQDFSVLIMDESLANVDELTRETIILKMKSLFPERCILYISHNVVEVAKFCDRILVFRGAHKVPQTKEIIGCDHRLEQSLDAAVVERTMLEIMNAS